MSEITGPDETLPPTIPLNEPTWQNEPVQPPPPEELLTSPAPLLRPVPFEDLEIIPGFWARVGAMFRLVFSNPMELFDRVPTTEGLGAPWRFLLLLSIPVFLIVALVFFLVGMGIMLAALEQSRQGDSKAIAAVIPFVFGAFLVLMPLFKFLGMLLGGTLCHFTLWMWGGTRRGVGLGQSIRAVGYASAFVELGGFIPLLGPLIQLAGWVFINLGLARMHKTEPWRGVCALFTQLVLFCCCIVLVVSPFIATILAAANR